MTRLAVIPARGGSKRIPNKNIKVFCGKPIIAWSIEAAMASNCFDRIIVSTDDHRIADIAEKYGAEVPFFRPPELCDDHTATAPVIAHAIQWHRQRNIDPEIVCCIYATAPLISADDIKKGLSLLNETKADYSFAVTRYEFPIQRAVKITASGRIEMFSPEHFKTRSQDLPEAFHDAGQFYWGRADAWLEERPIFSERAVPILLPRYRAQDIDTLEDWILTESLFSTLEKYSWD